MCGSWASDNEKGLPAWMERDGYQGVGESNPEKKWTKISQGLQPEGVIEYFECYQGEERGGSLVVLRTRG